MAEKKFSQRLNKIVAILNDGQYHDGNDIGRELNMTRSAVWKAISKLRAYGIKIDSIKGKGYQLQEPLILLDPLKIKSEVDNKQISISVFESITSTNDFIKKKSPVNAPQICLAEHQTHGRGRLDRSWYSPFGKNIYLSCAYQFKKDISELAGLSLVISLAIVKTLKSYGTSSELGVKWPNDVIYQGKKLAGNLVEITAESNGISHATIGIGMNVNMETVDIPINQAWISLKHILGCEVFRNELSARLINHLFIYLNRFEASGLSDFQDEWSAADKLRQKKVAIQNLHHHITGVVQGINEQGHLILQLKCGTLRAFSSGDTRILK